MPITALPSPPSRLKPSTFSVDMDAFLSALPQFVIDANSLEANTAAVAQTGTSTTSLTIATGVQSLTTQTGKGWATGQWLYLINSAAPANYMVGSVTSYTTGTGALALSITTIGGTGTAATWTIVPATPPGTVSGLTGGAAGQVPYQSAASTTAFTAAGTTGQILVSGGTTAPTWSSAPAVTTQALGNSTTTAASTAFVRANGAASSALPSKTAAATLTATDANSTQVWSGTVAATLTLPAASAVPAGNFIEFVCVGASMAACTISRAGTDTITDGEASLTNLVITQPGQAFKLYSNGSSGWTYVGPRRRYESAWTATLPAINTATTFTHGLGATPRIVTLVLECTTIDGTFAVGDRLNLPYTLNSTTGVPVSPIVNATQVILTTGSTSAFATTPKTGGNAVGLTAASWRYRVIAEV